MIYLTGSRELKKGWNNSTSAIVIRMSGEKLASSNSVYDNRQIGQGNENLIKGVRGLAKFLGCGVNKAQQIMHSGVLTSEKIAYKVGRKWIVKKKELFNLLDKNPMIFEKLSTK